MRTKTILFLADSDSQLKPAYLLASRIATELGWNIVGNLVPSRTRVSRRQLMGAKIDCPLTFHSFNHITSNLALDLDAIVVFLPGSRLHRFRVALEEAVRLRSPARRPLLITGYNGVVYEKHLEGLLWRVGYDLIGVNSRNDQELFEQILHQFGVDGAPLVRAGLTLAQGRKGSLDKVLDPNRDEPRSILFACQAAVPESREERFYLLDKLRDYALTHPERTVYVKPRTLPEEQTFHAEPYHYELLWREKYGDSKPPNLFFAYGSFRSYLKKTDVVVTVSSTAVFEAMVGGVPGVVLTDVGIKESLGNHFFVGSGLFATMDDVIADQLPAADPVWLARNGFGDDDHLEKLVARVRELHDAQEASGEYLPFAELIYTPTLTPYVYGRMLPKDEEPEPPPTRTDVLARKARKLYRTPGQFFTDAIANQKKRVEQLRKQKKPKSKKTTTEPPPAGK